MTGKKCINYIATFVLFVSMALSYCALPFKIGGKYITFALIFELAFFGIILLLNYKHLLIRIIEFYKHKEVIMVALFLSSVFFLGLLVMLLGGNSGIIRVLLTTLHRVLAIMIPLFFAYYVTKLLKNRTIIRILCVIIFIILCYGLFDFCIYKFHLSFLEPFFKFFINSHGPLTYKTIGFPRIQSFFAEPSHFAHFLVLFLPFVYTLSTGKYKIFNNHFINAVIKNLLLPLTIFELFATQAPIFIIAGIIVLNLVLMREKTIIFYFTAAIIVGALIFFNVEMIENISIFSSIISRIQNTLMSFTSLEQLVLVEPSLATRVISYINMWDVYTKHPILGCGCGNLPHEMYMQFTTSHFPLTKEIISSLIQGDATMNCNIFFQVVAESGFIAVFLLYSVFYLSLNRIKKYIKYADIWNKQILQAFFMYLCAFIILSFYDSSVYVVYGWVMLGIIIGYCDNLKIRKISIKTE